MNGSLKVAVFSVLLSCDVTAKPTSTLASRASVNCANCVHVVPSDEARAVNVLPLRTSLSQYGAVTHGPLWIAVDPPAVARSCAFIPAPGVMNAKTLRAFAAVDSRIITPAFAQPLVLPIEVRLASTVQSPDLA